MFFFYLFTFCQTLSTRIVVITYKHMRESYTSVYFLSTKLHTHSHRKKRFLNFRTESRENIFHIEILLLPYTNTYIHFISMYIYMYSIIALWPKTPHNLLPHYRFSNCNMYYINNLYLVMHFTTKQFVFHAELLFEKELKSYSNLRLKAKKTENNPKWKTKKTNSAYCKC